MANFDYPGPCLNCLADGACKVEEIEIEEQEEVEE